MPTHTLIPMEDKHVQEGEAQVLFDAIFHTSHVRNCAPDMTLCENSRSCRGQRQEKGHDIHMGPNSKDKFQRTEHTVHESVSEERKNSPPETPAGLQTGSPDRTPTSPATGEEFFLLRFSSGKKSWRARLPIFSTCSGGGNAKEQRSPGHWQSCFRVGKNRKWQLCSHAVPCSETRSPKQRESITCRRC